jgi:hypothetical protein
MIGMCQVIFSVLLIHVIFVTDANRFIWSLEINFITFAKAGPGGHLHHSFYQRSLQKKCPRDGALGQIEDLQGISNIPRNHG